MFKRNPFNFKYSYLIFPVLLVITTLIVIVFLILIIIDKSDKVKKEFNKPITIVSNCTIDNNKSIDNSIILNCKFKD